MEHDVGGHREEKRREGKGRKGEGRGRKERAVFIIFRIRMETGDSN